MGFPPFRSILNLFIVNYEVNGLCGKKERPTCGQWPSKKKFNPTPSNISNFFGHVTPYPKDDWIEKELKEDLTLFIAKELISLSFVNVPFFRKLILKQNPCLNFPLRQVLVNDILPRMVELTKNKYMFWSLSLVILASFLLIYGCLKLKWIPLS
jgi:hypothetical protein